MFDSIDIESKVDSPFKFSETIFRNKWEVSVESINTGFYSDEFYYVSFSNKMFVVEQVLSSGGDTDVYVRLKSNNINDIKNYFIKLNKDGEFIKKSDVERKENETKRKQEIENELKRKQEIPQIKAIFEKFINYGNRDWKIIFKNTPSIIVKNKSIKDLINDLSYQELSQIKDVIVNVIKY